jgi:glycosyltransferase involved in cell wall biosynthesis
MVVEREFDSETTARVEDRPATGARMRTPRVAVVMPSGRIAGAERVLISLLAELEPGNVIVCAPLGSPFGCSVELLGHTLAHFELPKLTGSSSRVRYASDYLRALSALRRVVHENDVSLVHSYVAFTSKVVAPVALVTRTPSVLSVHEITTAESIGWWRSRAQKLFASIKFQKLTAVSQYVADSLVGAGYPAGRVAVVPNGITRSSPLLQRSVARAELGISEAALVFLVVGRVTRWKGQDLALTAFQHFRRRHPEIDARLIVVGGAFEQDDLLFEAELQSRVATEGLRECVAFYGNQGQVDAFYDACDAVVVPSIEPDPFPTVVLEAGLAERPAIVTTLGGAREAVVHGQTGLLTEPNADDVAEAMDGTLDPRWRERVGREARRHIQSLFSSRTYAENVVALWCECAGGRSAASGRPSLRADRHPLDTSASWGR